MRPLLLGLLALAGSVPSAAGVVDPHSTPSSGAMPIRSVAGGGYAGYAVLANGRVWAWGDDLEGQIGDMGPQTSRTTPVEVPGIAKAILVAGGGNSAYALVSNGMVWAWGDNTSGQLGEDESSTRQRPGLVPHLTKVSSVAAGAFAAYAIRRDGSAWAWGDNSFGQLGTGTDLASSPVPKQIARLQGVVAVVAGAADAYALLKNGTVWAWGDNSLGQLGGARCGSVTAGHRSPCLGSRVPREVPGLAGVVAIAAGGDSGYALRNDGSVWAWGDDGFGELGNGLVLQDEPVPVRVHALSHVISVTAGSCSGYALRSDGTVWAWGRGDLGQLGDGRTTLQSTPVRVRVLTDVQNVTGGGDMAFALGRNGELWAWGADAYGQLGNASVTKREVPVRVLLR